MTYSYVLSYDNPGGSEEGMKVLVQNSFPLCLDSFFISCPCVNVGLVGNRFWRMEKYFCCLSQHMFHILCSVLTISSSVSVSWIMKSDRIEECYFCCSLFIYMNICSMTTYYILMPSNPGGNITLLVNCHNTEIGCCLLKYCRPQFSVPAGTILLQFKIKQIIHATRNLILKWRGLVYVYVSVSRNWYKCSVNEVIWWLCISYKLPIS